MKARIRPELVSAGIGIPTKCGNYLCLDGEFDYMQPDWLEDQEFNCIVVANNKAYYVMSIDLDFA